MGLKSTSHEEESRVISLWATSIFHGLSSRSLLTNMVYPCLRPQSTPSKSSAVKPPRTQIRRRSLGFESSSDWEVPEIFYFSSVSSSNAQLPVLEQRWNFLDVKIEKYSNGSLLFDIPTTDPEQYVDQFVEVAGHLQMRLQRRSTVYVRRCHGRASSSHWWRCCFSDRFMTRWFPSETSNLFSLVINFKYY